MSDSFWVFVARVAVALLVLSWVVSVALILLSPTGRIRDTRFLGWKFPRSKEQIAADKALEKAFRRVGGLSKSECAKVKASVAEMSDDMRHFENLPFDQMEKLPGFSAAIDWVKTDDSPLTVDRVLLEPGEIAVFDAAGALVVWFPAPDNPDRQMICQKSITVLTYDDMLQATPKMRDQLRLLKGGRHE